MPLPVLAAPAVGAVAARLAWLGAAVAVGVWLARRRGPERLDIASEDALDRVPEGADFRVGPGRADAEIRWARAARLGPAGPGLAVEIAGLARLRARRLGPRRADRHTTP